MVVASFNPKAEFYAPILNEKEAIQLAKELLTGEEMSRRRISPADTDQFFQLGRSFYTVAMTDDMEELKSSARFGLQHTPFLKIKLDSHFEKAAAILKVLKDLCDEVAPSQYQVRRTLSVLVRKAARIQRKETPSLVVNRCQWGVDSGRSHQVCPVVLQLSGCHLHDRTALWSKSSVSP